METIMPLTGTLAPDFTLSDQNAKMHTLSSCRGQWVLVYFYPKDDTPGCTAQACDIRDVFPQFQKMNARVFGISVDSEKSHEKFAAKYGLPFTLLADTDKKTAEAYGVWGKKNFMGREYMGIARTSFLISPQGIIVKVYEKVKPKAHAGEVLDDLGKFDKIEKIEHAV